MVTDTMYTSLEAGGCKEAKTILNAVLVFRTVFFLANMADSIGNAKHFTETYQDKDWDRWAKQLAGESKNYDGNVKLSDGNILGEYQKGVIKNKSGSYSGADNIADGARLKEYYRQAERYGTDSIKELENGRYKFYEELKLAKTQGEMAGARHVREWDLTVCKFCCLRKKKISSQSFLVISMLDIISFSQIPCSKPTGYSTNVYARYLTYYSWK